MNKDFHHFLCESCKNIFKDDLINHWSCKFNYEEPNSSLKPKLQSNKIAHCDSYEREFK